ncbi:MAG: RNA polymerase sigma factor [Anaerolineae bacterium]
MITFHDLYQRYASDVYRFAYWLSGNQAEAEDIASETFVRAWVGRHNIRTSTVKAYLFTIARNLFLQGQRQSKRHFELDFEQADTAPGPLETVSAFNELETIHEALQKLPEVDRAAFLMRVLDEIPYQEIANALSISLSAAKVKVHRTRIKLASLKKGDID